MVPSDSCREQCMKFKKKKRTCPAVKMATFFSFCPRKAILLVGKLFSCSAFPVARSKMQYLTQFPVFRTACTPASVQKNQTDVISQNILEPMDSKYFSME